MTILKTQQKLDYDVIPLPDKKWYRGYSRGSKLLRSEDNRQCCLGIAATYYGVPDEKIRNVADLEADHLTPILPEELKGVPFFKLYEVNDSSYVEEDDQPTSDQVRVDYLNLLLEEMGAKFRFVLK